MTSEAVRQTALGAGGEFDAIRGLLERWGPLAVGIGDDAAVLDVPPGERLVASTDTAVDDVHFRRDWMSPREIGYRAVTAALSDLAAMAASPLGILVSLQIPDDSRQLLNEIADGVGDAVRAGGTVIRGGNIAAGGAIAISTTVLGSALTPLRRAGARAGDNVYVTGLLGGPAAALGALRSGKPPAPNHRERFAHPVARIVEARWLAARGATAAIDLSDGLPGDAAHLAAASGVALELSLDDLPLLGGVSADDALGGEEYEILLTARAQIAAAEFSDRFGVPLTRVGAVIDGPPGVTFTRAGNRVAVPPAYDHFSR